MERSPTRMRPERSGPSLGRTVYTPTAEPAPVLDEVTGDRPTSAAADHLQSPSAVTENFDSLPVAVNEADAGETDSGHARGAAACRISMGALANPNPSQPAVQSCWPQPRTTPVLDRAPAMRELRSKGSLVEAVHLHAAPVAVTSALKRPPAALTSLAAGNSANEHPSCVSVGAIHCQYGPFQPVGTRHRRRRCS